MNDHNGTYGILVSFGFGLFVGSVTALLLAPAPGRETRRRLGELGQATLQHARKGMTDARSFAGDQARRIERALEVGKEAYREEVASH